MNTHAISLTSSTTNHIQTFSSLDLYDYTELTFNLEGLTEKITLSYVKIDWGDGLIETFDKNNIFVLDRTKINALKFNPILSETYSHEYYPSETSLYKSLTAQVLVAYTDDTYSWFIQPIRIRTYDYFEAVGDLTLLNTNILPVASNKKEHQFKCDVGGTLVELST